MNFLAHAYLSGSDDKILVGNFIGDFVKGRQIENFDPQIQYGIKLHREIDTFTDKHPIYLESKSILKSKYRHYSGVIVDMFYDHFLAVNWQDYSHVTLLEFTKQTYQILDKHRDELPARVKRLLTYMVPGNWLYSYAETDGLDKALTGMAHRTKFESHMEFAVEDLKTHYEKFQEDFRQFFPKLILFSESFKFVSIDKK